MLVTRLHALGKLAGAFTLFSEKHGIVKCAPRDNEVEHNLAFEAKYHPNPSGTSYDDNPTPFGRILEGSAPAYTYFESDNIIVLRDRTIRAKFHALVIPKRFIESIKTLTVDDLEMVHEMKETALYILEKNCPIAYKNDDYILCFHVPPFTSVSHLHLHVLAPASEMMPQYKWGKYLRGTPWCTGVEDVINDLKR